MRNLFFKAAQYVTGNDYAPKNPDLRHNVELLKESVIKIETGVLTRILKRPLVTIIETIIYIVTAILAILAFYFWSKIDNLFDSVDFIQSFGLRLSSSSDTSKYYSGYSYLILLIMLTPSLFCFLFARLFTKSRKRMAIFIDVENRIKTVIKNLS